MNKSEQINLLIQQEKYQEALGLLKQQAKAGADAALLSTMAHCNYRLGNFQQSADELTEALAMAPDKAQLYSDRGISYFMLGDREKSLRDFNKAQELEPQNPYRYSSRAYVKDAFRDTKGAIDDYQKALEIDPEDAISYNNLGLLLEKLGYQKQAQQHFAKADQIEGRKPGNAAAQPVSGIEKQSTATNNKPVANEPVPKTKMTAGYLGNTIKSIFTTRKGFQEFMQYWLGKRSDH
ncbi:tetratricopeptide repeat protein [Cesiribacter sp. SM1]|uniref:tetratricopeptide repeat protein n=1 Tax=Cesiribacter sp. SM1 TaxID=2861196 RepID=UPI001CD7F417|nr:tetratricopeptide repeat protein [Cesiribacter sp. SM1]